ncbi:MAG: SH3 domain-containing protein [Bacteroidetes bacterium]|nr:SH3 domain-containing protein [Bacteroidota bacterium]
MKACLFSFLLALCILPSQIFAIGTYVVGDQLYVHAQSGLILRETASPTGKKLNTLSYGTKLKVLSDGYRKTPHSVSPFEGYSIKGFWVKVSTPDGKEGFVFDGYLSKYKTVAMLPNGDDPNAKDNDATTIQERFLMMHADRKGKRIELEKGDGRYEHYRILFTNNADLEVNTGEGGSTYIIRFGKETTVEEAYLIGKELWLEDVEPVKSTISKGIITLTSGDELWQVEVQNKGGIVHLSMSHAD